MIRLFAYGTLKRGFHNNSYLQDSEYLGRHTTHAGYSMYDFGGYPAVTEKGGHAISGEIYRIEVAHLSAIDELEWYPDFYQRTLDTKFGEAWMYVVQTELCTGKPLLPGNWD